MNKIYSFVLLITNSATISDYKAINIALLNL